MLRQNTSMPMKRLVLRMVPVILLALLLVGCAAETVWLPLFDSPDPNRTPSPIFNPSATDPEDGGGVQADDNKLFQTDVESMDTPHFIIYKSRHVLELWDGDTLMARMKVALGKNEGPKQREGDGKTPEGTYYTCKTSEEGRYYRSFFFSYPNADDALAGLDEQAITQEQYDQIVSAIDGRETPPWDTKLGGEIAISGTGDIGDGLEGDWTGGNIAVSDEDMDYLWKFVSTGVDVVINP